MANQNDIDRWQQGKDHWNRWAKGQLSAKEKLENEGIWEVNDDGTGANEETRHWFDASQVNFSSHSFEEKADFRDVIFPHTAHFSKTEFKSDAVFINASFLGEARFENASFSNAAVFLNATFYGAANFGNATFLRRAEFPEAHFKRRTNFERANLRRSTFSGTNLKEGNFDWANLEGADFSGADLSAASMLRVKFNVDTKFGNARVEACKVDRYALECLQDYSDLTVGARMSMDIHDDVATLRSSYSGFLQWVHFAALIGFLFPYLWFIVSQWGKATFLLNHSENFIPLWQAISQFIFNGGENWERGFSFHWSFLLFIIALLYNALRSVLLMKTKQLELIQESSGLPAAFSMDEKVFDKFWINWRHLFLASRFGFYLYLGVVFSNLWHFLTMEIPVSP